MVHTLTKTEKNKIELLRKEFKALNCKFYFYNKKLVLGYVVKNKKFEEVYCDFHINVITPEVDTAVDNVRMKYKQMFAGRWDSKRWNFDTAIAEAYLYIERFKNKHYN